MDVDDTVRQTYGYAKGAGLGYTGTKGPNVLFEIISTPSSRRLIAAARLRKGSTNGAKGAHRQPRHRQGPRRNGPSPRPT